MRKKQSSNFKKNITSRSQALMQVTLTTILESNIILASNSQPITDGCYGLEKAATGSG
jgi:hypothetical protein